MGDAGHRGRTRSPWEGASAPKCSVRCGAGQAEGGRGCACEGSTHYPDSRGEPLEMCQQGQKAFGKLALAAGGWKRLAGAERLGWGWGNGGGEQVDQLSGRSRGGEGRGRPRGPTAAPSVLAGS